MAMVEAAGMGKVAFLVAVFAVALFTVGCATGLHGPQASHGVDRIPAWTCPNC